jgi:hypothetical protein
MTPTSMVKVFTPFQIFYNYLKESFLIVQKNFKLTLAFNILYILLLTAIYSGLMFPILHLVYDRENQDMLLGFTSIPIVSYFTCGFIKYYLRLVRNQPISIKYLFLGSKKYLQITILLLLYYSLYILLIKITTTIYDYDKIMQIRIILGVLLFFIIVARLIYSPLFVIDAEYNARDAMRSSFLLTSGKTKKVLTLLISSLLLLVFFLFLMVLLSFMLFKISEFIMVYNIYQIAVPVIILTASYPFAIIMIAFIISYDINLKNKYSKRKKLINEAAIFVKKKLAKEI